MKGRAGILLVLAAVSMAAWSGCGPKTPTESRGLTEKDRNLVRERLAGMRDEVELLSFTGEDDAGREAAKIYDEIASLQPKVTRKALHPEREAAEARGLGVSYFPAVVIKKGSLTGLRFYGVPEGFEFPTFLEAIDRLSRNAPALSARTAGTLADLRVPIDFKVFVAPS